MEIIIKALSLFFYGIYADIYKYMFECELKKRFLAGENISCPALSAKSNKNYCIQSRLRKLERELQYMLYAK